MKINFGAEITDFEGTPINGPDQKPITLRSVAIQSLVGDLIGPDGRPEYSNGELRIRLYDLAHKIHTAKEPVDLPVEDVALIKDRVGRGFGTMIVGSALKLLDPA